MKKYILLSMLFPMVAGASGTVGSFVKFPPKKVIKLDSSNFKCKTGESLKDCVSRYKEVRKNNGANK